MFEKLMRPWIEANVRHWLQLHVHSGSAWREGRWVTVQVRLTETIPIGLLDRFLKEVRRAIGSE